MKTTTKIIIGAAVLGVGFVLYQRFGGSSLLAGKNQDVPLGGAGGGGDLPTGKPVVIGTAPLPTAVQPTRGSRRQVGGLNIERHDHRVI